MKNILSQEKRFNREATKMTELPTQADAINLQFSTITPLPSTKRVVTLKHNFAQLDLRVDKSFYFHHCMIGIYLDIQNITGNKLKQPDVIMSTGIIENPSAPVAEQRYKMKYLKQESGTILPTLGITVEF